MSGAQRPVSVRRTRSFSEDLEVLQRGGLSASDAIREAVKLMAQAHRTIDQITEVEGKRPVMLSIYVTSLTRPYDARRDRRTGGARGAQDGGESR